MKICSFCNTENKDDAVKCVSCGANTFKFKCENCGTVFEDGAHCPHCGVKAGQEARKCPVCNTEYYTNACPTCGYVPGGKSSTSSTPPANNAPQPSAPPKRKTWLWVLGWIFIFPLPLTLILLKKQNMSKGLKYGIIAAAWILYILIAIGGAASNNNKSVPVDQNAKQATIAATEKETKKPTEKPTEKSTEKPTSTPTEKPTSTPTEAPTPIVFTNYTDHVEAGSTASVTIQGAPNTEYNIDVFYSTKEAEADGLENKTSDADGYVTWEWKVGTNTAKGEHSISVRGGGSQEQVTFVVD